VAQDNATVVEISRESFLRILLHQPDVALKIIAEISSRFRKTDDIVREYSSRIYREAHDNIEKELKSKLNSVEILYNAIEKTALTTVEHVERSWTTLTRFIRSVTVVTAVAVAVLSWLGIKEYNNIKLIRDEVSKNLQIIEKEVSSIEIKAKEANELVDDIKTLKKSNNIIENITLKLGKIREDLALDKGRIEELSLESLNLGNQSYRRSKESLMKYVINYKNYDAEVVLEAISITLELFKQKKMVLYREDIMQIHDVLIAFAISSGHNWRVRRSIRANSIVIKNLTGDIGFQTLKYCKSISADKNVYGEVLENASIIIFSLGYEGIDIKKLFREYI
jgi:Leucine-rich repeat (LRR) protein